MYEIAVLPQTKSDHKDYVNKKLYRREHTSLFSEYKSRKAHYDEWNVLNQISAKTILQKMKNHAIVSEKNRANK